MSKIGGGGGMPPIKKEPTGEAHESGQAGKPAATDKAAPKAADRFERTSAQVGSQLGAELQKLRGQKLQFNDQELAQIAASFAHMIVEDPQMERAERAKRFAQSVLRGQRFKKLMGSMKPEEVEEMCDMIGDVLSSSPGFGQLVDQITRRVSQLDQGA